MYAPDDGFDTLATAIDFNTWVKAYAAFVENLVKDFVFLFRINGAAGGTHREDGTWHF